MLRFLADVLGARGHEVLAVQAVGAGDLGRCAEVVAAGPVDALFVDLRMPLDPAEVVATVRGRAPAAIVILCTGSEVRPEDHTRIQPDAVLKKPFTSGELARALEAARRAGEER
ncbi:MAG: hypothetical protein M9894_29935 [Planctomycetes bacterium]|nr:hypothetical protein [Planctomycetota bacterium]